MSIKDRLNIKFGIKGRITRGTKHTGLALSSLVKQKNRRAVFIVSFVLVGGLLLVAVNAASQSIQIEAENGTPTMGASAINGDATTSGGRYIQFGLNNTGGGCADGPNFTSTNICINPASIPAARNVTSRAATTQIRNSRVLITDANSFLVSAVRMHCGFSHVSRNDPIVYPGQKNATHWHIFSGNTAADETTTDTNTAAASTCPGGTLNRTAYWAPALIDTSSYNPTTKQFNMARPMFGDDSQNPGAPSSGGAFMQAYYKTGYNGVLSRNVNWFPKGLRMIAGGYPTEAPTGPPLAQTPNGPDGRMVSFDCISWGDAGSVWGTPGIDHGVKNIPTRCPPNFYIQATIIFPQCGAVDTNGNPVLDSPDHRKHMSYPLGWPDKGCPASHPRAYPEVMEHFRWRVPASGAAGLRFSSDIYPGSQPGWTFHADWWNGWDEATGQKIINNCYRGGSNERGYDCQNDELGDGTKLTLDP